MLLEIAVMRLSEDKCAQLLNDSCHLDNHCSYLAGEQSIPVDQANNAHSLRRAPQLQVLSISNEKAADG